MMFIGVWVVINVAFDWLGLRSNVGQYCVAGYLGGFLPVFLIGLIEKPPCHPQVAPKM